MKIASLAVMLFLLAGSAWAGATSLYVGTYTRGGKSQGIYRVDFDGASGRLGQPVLAAEADNPSFLAFDGSGGFVYAVAEIPGGDGRVAAYRRLDSGALEFLGARASGGSGPCHLSLSPDGRTLVLANYGGGSVASYRVEKDGSLSEAVSRVAHRGSSVDPKRQQGPHAHSVNFSGDGRWVYAADLGTDRIYRYAVDAGTGALELAGETAVEPGSGPRHLAFRPDRRFAYVINEMGLTVTALSVEADSGNLTAIQNLSTLPEGTAKTGSTAELLCHPSGRFLYGSNRGHDSIVVYRIDPRTGTLDHVENESIRGRTPRSFVLSPDGKWLLAAGQDSDSVAVFAVDPETGALEFSGSEISVPSPVCLRFVSEK